MISKNINGFDVINDKMFPFLNFIPKFCDSIILKKEMKYKCLIFRPKRTLNKLFLGENELPENYHDLIVHGPLQATYLLRAAEKLTGKTVKYFMHKVMAPVFANSEYIIGAKQNDDGSVSCWGATESAGVTMQAESKF